MLNGWQPVVLLLVVKRKLTLLTAMKLKILKECFKCKLEVRYKFKNFCIFFKGNLNESSAKKRVSSVQLPNDFNVEEFISQQYLRKARSKQSVSVLFIIFIIYFFLI